MWNFFERFEDCDKSLLGPNLKILQTWGIWGRNGMISNIMYYYFLFGCFYFVPSQYVELWILRNNLDSALRNLSYSLLSTICFMKAINCIMWKNEWKEIIDYITDLEKRQRAEKNEKIDAIIKSYTKYSRIVTYFYCGLASLTVLAVTLAPVVAGFCFSESRERILNGTDPYPEIMSSWVPFDKSRGLGYCVLFISQACGYVWGGGLVGGFDSTVVTMMCFFAGQLKILKLNCQRLLEDDGTILLREEVMSRVIACFHHHENLMKHCDILNSLLSPVMFMYVIICSIMICASATTMTTESIALVQQIWLAEYLVALISQLFLYCWHSNEVFYCSLDVDYGIFSSGWCCHDKHVRHNIMLLSGKLRRTVQFTAGPFTALGVETFITIIKASYSYYTLLK